MRLTSAFWAWADAIGIIWNRSSTA